MTLAELENAIARTKEYFQLETSDIEVTLWLNDQPLKVHSLSRFHIVPEFVLTMGEIATTETKGEENYD